MNTFLDAYGDSSRSFVIYGNLNDAFICADLTIRTFEQMLVKYLKSRGYKHIIFYGDAATKGAYCLDHESTRFFFGENRELPVIVPDEDNLQDDETGDTQKPAPAEKPSGRAGNSSVSGGASMRDLFSKHGRKLAGAEPFLDPAGTSSPDAGKEAENTPKRVRYSRRNMTLEAFHSLIQPRMLDSRSDMAVIFYNFFTTKILELPSFADEVLHVWEQGLDIDTVPNICLFLAPETEDNTEELTKGLANSKVASKFIALQTDSSGSRSMQLNPKTCFQIDSLPQKDEVKNLLRRLSIIGTDGRHRKITFPYAELDAIANEIQYACRNAGRYKTGGDGENMKTIIARLTRFIESSDDRPCPLTPETVDEIWGCPKQKRASSAKEKRTGTLPAWERAGWATQRLAVPDKEVEEDASLESVLEELNQLIGLSGVKEKVRELAALAETNKRREEQDLPTEPNSFHMVFLGNPGTGKTTVARLIGKLYKALGLLPRGHFVEADSEKLVSGYVGHTASKTKAVIQSALGGVLFIDEVYSLADSGHGSSFNHEAINTLVKEMEDHRDELVVIAAGYPKETEDFINSNPGLASRFNTYITFADYSLDELCQIMQKSTAARGYSMTDEAQALCRRVIENGMREDPKQFGNGRYVRNLLEKLIQIQSVRIIALESPTRDDLMKITEEDIPAELLSKLPPEDATVEDLLGELDALIGLNSVKKEVRQLIDYSRVSRWRRNHGLPVTPLSMHMVFAGNPGTGKTTVARLIGRIYKAMGILPRGHTVETNRAGLVAGYVGQTAIKTQEKIDEALRGVLFIDEAYSLNQDGFNSDTFGQEAIDTLVKAMEDHYQDLVVIVAGYPNEMEKFISSNPGFASRFNKTIVFEDYSLDELCLILNYQLTKRGYTLTEGAQIPAKEIIRTAMSTNRKNFGNGRYIRNLCDDLVRVQSGRILALETPTREALMEITEEDVSALT